MKQCYRLLLHIDNQIDILTDTIDNPPREMSCTLYCQSRTNNCSISIERKVAVGNHKFGKNLLNTLLTVNKLDLTVFTMFTKMCNSVNSVNRFRTTSQNINHQFQEKQSCDKLVYSCESCNFLLKCAQRKDIHLIIKFLPN